MFIALFSLLISIGITTIAYHFYQLHTKSSEVNRVRRRLGLKTEAERLAESHAPALIRSSERKEPQWLRALGPRLRINERLQLMIESAGLKTSPERFQKKCVLAAMLTGGSILFSGQHWLTVLALPAAALASLIPVLQLRRAGCKRLTRFESQFPGALEFVARSMRAGHAFSVSLEMLHHESEQPLAGEFRRVVEEQNLGMPLDTALARLASRIHLIDVQFFVSAVVLQRKTGGNLPEVLDTLAEVIRERYKLKGKIQAISAHGRMTAHALSAIPIVVGGMMFTVNAEYASFFFHTTIGLQLLLGSLTLQVIAYVVIKKIVTIEV